MRTIGLVALHVFRDSVRDKVLYSIVAFAVVLMAVSYLIGQLTAGQDLKIIKDLGLAAMSLMGLFIAVFIGIGLIAREIDRRSIYAMLAKPVRRHELIARQISGTRRHAVRQPRGHGRGLLPGARPTSDRRCRRRH